MLGFNVSTTNTDLEKQAAEDYLPLGILEELANRSLDVVGDGIPPKIKARIEHGIQPNDNNN